MDLRQPTSIGALIDAEDEQILHGGDLDHNFVVRGAPGRLRPAARVIEKHSGQVMEVLTSQPGIQFYSGNMLPDALSCKADQVYQKRSGFCLEIQNFPDSPNKPQFPSPVLRPGQHYSHKILFRFCTE